jgi:hypothetical protein
MPWAIIGVIQADSDSIAFAMVNVNLNHRRLAQDYPDFLQPSKLPKSSQPRRPHPSLSERW